MRLIAPSTLYQQQFIAFYREIEAAGEENRELYQPAQEDFQNYVNEITLHVQGKNLPEGWGPSSTFWMVDDSDNIVGVVRIRHNINAPILRNEIGHIGYDIAPSCRRKGYGTLILKMALSQAHELGISKLRLTADENNLGSRKIIERNGGMLDELKQSDEFNRRTATYWIDIK
ncbi:GNAT family N-acetyltransferase [Vibrio nitrifigilis]|uniref:GNAT family N-acetyltransferase n=1 Tax=Vibrio nitrifigilis TaxID=2789781 RepID=A0ABS0GJA4_9VIBR|nr:GNAT family N-acetyltransferase [Vibrio nitrifigilis]MBF9002534.1 GNAT family N-acetyltransferase [Vibrio nitrifigilis]